MMPFSDQWKKAWLSNITSRNGGLNVNAKQIMLSGCLMPYSVRWLLYKRYHSVITSPNSFLTKRLTESVLQALSLPFMILTVVRGLYIILYG